MARGRLDCREAVSFRARLREPVFTILAGKGDRAGRPDTSLPRNLQPNPVMNNLPARTGDRASASRIHAECDVSCDWIDVACLRPGSDRLCERRFDNASSGHPQLIEWLAPGEAARGACRRSHPGERTAPRCPEGQPRLGVCGQRPGGHHPSPRTAHRHLQRGVLLRNGGVHPWDETLR